MVPAVDVKGLTVCYGTLVALSGVTATIPGGRMTVIMGPNGSGKSTLLRAVLGLVTPRSGTVQVLGRSPEKARGSVAYVPQRDEVDWEFPLVARDVVAMGRLTGARPWRRPGPADLRAVDGAMKALGIAHLALRPIGHLSAGQRQRVFVARALAVDAQLYLMDEPLTGVDAATEEVIFDCLVRLRRAGKTVIAVHHRPGDVSRFDHVLLLNGCLEWAGPADALPGPGNARGLDPGIIVAKAGAVQCRP